jgi:hypothetical protein
VRLAVVMTLAAVACSDQPGLTLRVLPNDSTVTTLRVLISDRSCTASNDPESTGDCSGISLASDQPIVPGHIRFLDDGSAGDGSDLGDPILDRKDGEFVVRLLPNPDGSTRNVHLALIGFDANDTALGLAELTFDGSNPIPAAATLEQIDLAPLDSTLGTTVELAHGGGGVCVEIDNAPAAQQSSTVNEFYVPVEDPDCDGIPLDKECQPYIAHFSGVFGGSDSDVGTCGAATTIAAGGTACLLGAGTSSCSDGSGDGTQPPLTGCDPVDGNGPAPCLPDPMCTPPCAADLDHDHCFGADFEGLAQMAHIDCQVQQDSSGGGFCPGVFVPLGSGFALPPDPGACTLQVQAIGTGQIALDGFDVQAQFVDSQGDVDSDPVQIVTNPTPDLAACGLGVTIPDTNASSMNGNGPQTIGYVEITAGGAAKANASPIILPMRLLYPTNGGPGVDCTQTPTTCQFVRGQNDDTGQLLGCLGFSLGSGSGSDGSGSGSAGSGI